MKTALIIGIGGQDGSYLAEILLEKGYRVHGVVRRSSGCNTQRITHTLDKITLHKGDLCDTQSILNVIGKVLPQEIYNLADQDDVGWSYEVAGYNYDVTGAAVGRLLEGLKILEQDIGAIRFFQAISATIFGNAPPPQTEETPLNPLSPYACAKAFALHLCRYYREVHGMHVSTAIFYNHDSPRRGEGYLLNKIARATVRIESGVGGRLELAGPLDTLVDIGYAPEYALSAWGILQSDAPNDLIISSPKVCTIRTLIETAFEIANLSISGHFAELPSSTLQRPGPIPRMVGLRSKAGSLGVPLPISSYRECLEAIMEDEGSKI